MATCSAACRRGLLKSPSLSAREADDAKPESLLLSIRYDLWPNLHSGFDGQGPGSSRIEDRSWLMQGHTRTEDLRPTGSVCGRAFGELGQSRYVI